MMLRRSAGPRCTFLTALVYCLTPAPTAEALWQLTWDRIDVEAHLDNAGALHVSERMFLTLEGGVTTLERKIATSTDQEFVLRRLVREDEGQETTFIEGWDKRDQYMWRDRALTWWIRDASDPEWEEGQTVVYRLDYEIRNALTPAWDIPAGPDTFQWDRDRFPHFFARLASTIGTWVQAPSSIDRRYRLEHIVIFPWFSEREREELNYTLRYDTNWRRVHPESEIGHGTRGSDFRVTQLFDYLAPGWPPAIDLWKPATRVGSIFAFIALAALFWAIAATGTIRRWGLVRPPLNRRWFEEHIGSQRPELFAWQLGLGVFLSIAPFLGRLRAMGVIAVQSTPAADQGDPPTIDLQLLTEPAALVPHERLVIRALFPQGRESGSALLSQYYAQPGFSPEGALEEAVAHDQPRGEAKRVEPISERARFWRIIQGLSPWVCLTVVALLVLDTVYGRRPMELVLGCVAGLAVVLFAAAILPKLFERFEAVRSGGTAALVSSVAVLAAIMSVVAIHLYRNTPISAPGSAAVALMALWGVAALLYVAHGEDSGPQRIAVLGARYASRELQKKQPALDDTWIPHLTVLGLDSLVAAWCERHRSGAFRSASIEAGTEAGFDTERRFTGRTPYSFDQEWIDALYVPSEEDRQEEAADEAGEEEEGETGER